MDVKCQVCGKILKNRSYLKEHANTHEGISPYVCRLCGRKFVNKGNLNKHINKHHKREKVKCPACKLKFKNVSDVSRHRKTDGKFKCVYCCQHYNKWGYIRKHCKERHLNEEQPPNREPIQSSNGTSSWMNNGCKSKEILCDDISSESLSSQMQSEQGIKPQMSIVVAKNDQTNTIQSNILSVLSTENDDSKKVNINRTIANSANQSPSRQWKNISGANESSTIDLQITDPNQTADDYDGAPLVLDDGECPVLPMFYSPTGSSFNEVLSANTGNLSKQSNFPCHQRSFDKNDLFVLKAWMLRNDDESLDKIKTKLDECRASIPEFVLFLRGDWKALGENVIEDLFHISEKLCGNFVKAILLVDYLRTLGFERQQLVYMHHKNFITKLSVLIQMNLLYLLQKRLRLDHPKLTTWDSLPREIRAQLSLDFFPSVQNLTNGSLDFKSTVITIQEQVFLLKINNTLTQILYENVDLINVDGILTIEQKVASFGVFLSKYLESFSQDLRLLVFDILMKTNQSTRVETVRKEISAMYGRKRTIVLNVHEEMLHSFGVGDTLSNKLVFAAPKDGESFIDILYMTEFTKEVLSTKITVGVINIAQSLGIQDIWGFLFRGKYNAGLFRKDNQRKLLHILFKLNRQTEIEEIVRNVSTIFSGDNLVECLNGLPPRYVIAFIKDENLQLDHFQKYKILINWAFDSDQKKCNDPMHPEYIESVDRKFVLVKNSLPFNEMHDDFGTYLETGYFKVEDYEITQKAVLQTALSNI